MHKKSDTKLDKFLNSYKVLDADSALLESIVAQVQSANDNSIDYFWVRNAAMLAATAIMGFWLGCASVPIDNITNQNTTQNSGKITLDKVIFGPKTLSEVML